MYKLKELCREYLPKFRFDHLAIAVVDFKSKQIDTATFIECENEVIETDQKVFFDVASITKPLTLGLTYQTEPKLFDGDMKLLLEHRGGIPEWGLLPKHGWRDIINAYKIRESDTAYSDFSALRLQLEIEKAANKPLHELVKNHWDSEVLSWKDLADEYCPPTGFRNGKIIQGIVHDPNAYTINEFCSHAGAFATIEGVAKTFLELNQNTDFIKKVASEASKKCEQRFICGFDTISKDGESLAGQGCSDNTFGHLGFTGTSIWIDPEKMIGSLIFSNATKWFWYDKKLLNEFRKETGRKIWENF